MLRATWPPTAGAAAMEKGINPEDPGRHHHKWMEKEEVDFQASEWYQRRGTMEEVASVLFQSISDTTYTVSVYSWYIGNNFIILSSI